MQERPEEKLAEELQAIMDSFPYADTAAETDGEEATPENDGEAEAETEIDEDAIRARLRQVRQDTAHIPVVEEREPGLINKIKGLFGR